jgi:hypothetical protein
VTTPKYAPWWQVIQFDSERVTPRAACPALPMVKRANPPTAVLLWHVSQDTDPVGTCLAGLTMPPPVPVWQVLHVPATTPA